MASTSSSSAVNNLFLFPPHSAPPFASPQSLSFSSARKSRGALLEARAKKKNHKRKDNSIDYIQKSHDLNGIFPEAVLLKKKTVKEDGQALPEFADAEEEKLYEALSLQLESDLNLERMRHYEVVFLIHEKHDEQVEEIVTKVEDFIREKKGRIWRLNDWGLRRLGYRLKKAWQAHYILMNFEIDAKFINGFKTMLDKDERVIRHMVTKMKKAETDYCPPPMEYHTMLAKQGFGDDDDDGFWDDDDGDDGADDGGAENDGKVIYVDGVEAGRESRDRMRKVETVSR